MQRADPDNMAIYAEQRTQGPIGLDCATNYKDGVYTIDGLYLELWELDPGPGVIGRDDHVSTLFHGSAVNIILDCNDDRTECTGRTDWLPVRNENVSAAISVTIGVRTVTGR